MGKQRASASVAVQGSCVAMCELASDLFTLLKTPLVTSQSQNTFQMHPLDVKFSQYSAATQSGRQTWHRDT